VETVEPAEAVKPAQPSMVDDELDDSDELSDWNANPVERYMDLASWEDAVKSVMTVERNAAGDLLAYLVM
jgi:hypothetical protein